MKSENLIHIRLEAGEARISKKDVLSTEMSLLRIAQHINNYRKLRNRELEVKAELSENVKEWENQIRAVKRALPKLKIPKILEDREKEEEKVQKKLEKEVQEAQEKRESKIKRKEAKKEKEHTKHRTLSDDIEDQLKDIQEKLSQLG